MEPTKTQSPSPPKRRGLGSLIPGAETSPGRRTVREVPLEAITPNPYQPRQDASEEALEELAASIREHGIMQPLVVRMAGEGYQLIAGWRRREAARRAGLEEVPVMVCECEDRQMLELALVENLQREDINPIDEALALRRLMDEFGLTQEEISERLGRSRTSVANGLRLLTLPQPIQTSISRGQISPGHGRALLSLDNTVRMMGVWERILHEGLSVRQAEALAARPTSQADVVRENVSRETIAQPSPPTDDYGTKDPNLIALVDRLRERLQTRVRLRPKGEGGQVAIEYYSDDDFDRICGCILGEEACEPTPAEVE